MLGLELIYVSKGALSVSYSITSYYVNKLWRVTPYTD